MVRGRDRDVEMEGLEYLICNVGMKASIAGYITWRGVSGVPGLGCSMFCCKGGE